LGWPGAASPSVEALIDVFVVDGGPSSACESGRAGPSEVLSTRLPWRPGRFAPVLKILGAAGFPAPGAGPLER
jgi:hypothetical protein